MTAERWKQIQTEGGWVDLSNRAKWRMVGADRLRYLNGQVTNDIRRATSERAVYACVTDVKGRIFGDLYVRAAADAESLLLDAEAELRESLAARLERYMVADEVECLDETEEWRLVHGFGARGFAMLEKGVTAERYGAAGVDRWLSKDEVWTPAAEGKITADELEVWRVLQGVPKFPQELGGEVFPPEAGLETKAIDYAKGCYIGQEIISRMRTTGKMPRSLVRWAARDADSGIASGNTVYEVAGEQRALGVVTSVVGHPETGLLHGLAYLKQAAVPMHSELLVGAAMITIGIVH
jgi:folate-binding protein YgfZ